MDECEDSDRCYETGDLTDDFSDDVFQNKGMYEDRRIKEHLPARQHPHLPRSARLWKLQLPE